MFSYRAVLEDSAAAVCSHLWQALRERRPIYIVVEPDKADCLFRSAVAGKPTVVHGALDTIMAGLACGEVSLLAWKILQSGVDAFMTVTDAAAAEMMCILGESRYGDDPVVAGESAVAGLVGLRLRLVILPRGSGFRLGRIALRCCSAPKAQRIPKFIARSSVVTRIKSAPLPSRE